MKYFEVQAMCGHVGKGNYISISFAVIAENKKAAAAKVRDYARVKHHHKNAIRYVLELSLDDYLRLKDENDADPYLHCKNIQEQRQIGNIDLRICQEPDEDCTDKQNRTSSVEYRLKKNHQLVKAQKSKLQEYYRDVSLAS